MITNTRQLQLRETQFKCLAALEAGKATGLEQDYLDLYRIVEDLASRPAASGSLAIVASAKYAFLLGK